MRLNGKLTRWQQAGLLSAEQRAAIVEYERQHAFGWQNGLVFLGVFAIIVGILAVVAANWQAVPPWVKLGTHLALNLLLALGVLRKWERPVVAQVCLLLWYGLTLTFIGLMGQVFHLAGSNAAALLLWTALTSAAVVAFATEALVLLPWVLGTLGTLVAAYAEFARPLLGTDLLLPWLLFGAMLPAALAILAARLPAARWQALATQLLWLAGLLPVVTAMIACQFWYSDTMRAFAFTANDVIATLAVAALAVALACNSRLGVPEWLETTANFRLVLLTACGLITLPFLFPRVESGLLAALGFIALWLLLGWLGHRTQGQRLVSLAILVVALRLFIVYLEVFGSLLQTGFGLIFSGALLLALMYGARGLSRKVGQAPSVTPLTGGEA